MLGALSAFVNGEISPLTSRPEEPVSPASLARIADGAQELGLLGSGESGGLGLWEAGPAFTATALSSLGRSSAGVAWHLGSLAMGQAACRDLQLPIEPSALVSLRGAAGPGRGSLGRWLRGNDLDSAQQAQLADQLPRPGGAVMIQAGEGWERLVLPTPVGRGVGWAVVERQRLEITILPHSHGLDETRTLRIVIPQTLQRSPAAPGSLCAPLARLAISTMAVGHGSTAAAFDRARRYAAERNQGGGPIVHHPAVQVLLGRARAHLCTVEALLRGLGPLPSDPAGLTDVLAIYASAHTLLCQAATDVLQVLGGYGYMRDYGQEKALRDAQHLKLLFAPPRDIHLFLGAAEVA